MLRDYIEKNIDLEGFFGKNLKVVDLRVEAVVAEVLGLWHWKYWSFA